MRLTSRGAGVGLLAVVTLVLGVVFNLPELVGLAAGLTFLVVVSILAVAARPRVDVARSTIAEWHAIPAAGRGWPRCCRPPSAEAGDSHGGAASRSYRSPRTD